MHAEAFHPRIKRFFVDLPRYRESRERRRGKKIAARIRPSRRGWGDICIRWPGISGRAKKSKRGKNKVFALVYPARATIYGVHVVARGIGNAILADTRGVYYQVRGLVRNSGISCTTAGKKLMNLEEFHPFAAGLYNRDLSLIILETNFSCWLMNWTWKMFIFDFKLFQMPRFFFVYTFLEENAFLILMRKLIKLIKW